MLNLKQVEAAFAAVAYHSSQKWITPNKNWNFQHTGLPGNSSFNLPPWTTCHKKKININEQTLILKTKIKREREESYLQRRGLTEKRVREQQYHLEPPAEESSFVFRARMDFIGGFSSREGGFLRKGPPVRRRGNRPLLEYHRQRERPRGDGDWREPPATGEMQGTLREEEGSGRVWDEIFGLN